LIFTIVDKEGTSVNHASLVIIFTKQNQSAFDELKFNPTIVTYMLFYITRITASKKSDSRPREVESYHNLKAFDFKSIMEHNLVRKVQQVLLLSTLWLKLCG